jgi:hypothetical protein
VAASRPTPAELLFSALGRACEKGSTVMWRNDPGSGTALLDGYFDLDAIAQSFALDLFKCATEHQSESNPTNDLRSHRV